jgi:hypothetical protein
LITKVRRKRKYAVDSVVEIKENKDEIICEYGER